MIQAEILPADMKVLMNHIYEFKKGVRNMILFTFNQRYKDYAEKRLQSNGISYIIQPVGNDRLNLFFGKRECLDAIRASMTDDEYKGYLKGNIIKYLWRYEWKNGLEDLKKAQFYQNRLIEIVQAEKVRGDSMHT